MTQVAILVISFEHIFLCSFVGICMEQTSFLVNILCSNLVSFFTCFLAVSTLLRHVLEVMQVIKLVWASLAYLPVFRFRAEVCCFLLRDVCKAILYKRRMCSMPPFEISLQFFWFFFFFFLPLKQQILAANIYCFLIHSQPIISLRMHLISKDTSSRHCHLPLCSLNCALDTFVFCSVCVFLQWFCYSLLHRTVPLQTFFQQ